MDKPNKKDYFVLAPSQIAWVVRDIEKSKTLYRSFGFRDIEAYPEMEIPEEFKDYLLFMELDLADEIK